MKKSTTIFVSIIATLLVPYQVHSQKLESIFLSASENRDVPIQKNAFNASFKSFLGISDDYSFKPYDSVAGIKKENEVDALGFNNIRYLQYYKGIKVENADIRVRFRDDKFHSLNGEYVKCTGINTNTILSKTEAIRKAKIFFAGIHDVDSTSLKSYHQTPELVICNNHMRPSDTALYTAFKIDIFSTDKFVHEYIYVDAVSGVILNHLSLIKNEREGTAATRYSGPRQISTEHNGNNYVLIDNTRGNGIKTYNMQRTLFESYSSAINFTDNDNNWTAVEFHNSNKDDGALDAHWGAMMTYDYFKQVHGRNSYDNNNSALNN